MGSSERSYVLYMSVQCQGASRALLIVTASCVSGFQPPGLPWVTPNLSVWPLSQHWKTTSPLKRGSCHTLVALNTLYNTPRFGAAPAAVSLGQRPCCQHCEQALPPEVRPPLSQCGGGIAKAAQGPAQSVSVPIPVSVRVCGPTRCAIGSIGGSFTGLTLSVFVRLDWR